MLTIGREGLSSTHCHTSVHRPFRWCMNEEEGPSRNSDQGSDGNNIEWFKLAQVSRIIFIIDNQEDVQGHGKCPEYVGERKPVKLVNFGMT